ncbi:MAG: polysaccharide deacetylase family protein [Lachnospiraceae bacterium]|nr:polysaccharide deacetylase family protein [Lachnospiraceae bacterium]
MEFLYKDGKKQALTFSFDDNQDHDKRLIEIFNKNGLKGTFNVNSGTLSVTADRNPDGNIYITKEEFKEVYKGHEVAVHGVNHKYIANLTDSMIVNEFLEDRKALEELTGTLVEGAAYAFGWHNEHIMNILKTVGIKYSRGVDSTYGFFPPQDFLDWRPTCHQAFENIMQLGKDFLDCPGYIELPLMYVWGHSYEFGRSGNWDDITKFCEMMGGKDFIWYATNMEICDYINVTRSLEFSADGKKAYNPTLIEVFYKTNDGFSSIKPGEYKLI